VIEKILSRMKGHSMFQGKDLERLKMCEDCRVRAMFNDEAAGGNPASPGG
jgi:hypothetical protein